jgi:hypothetical protein
MVKLNTYRVVPALLIILAGLFSCEKIIDISVPDRERKMVVNGLLHPWSACARSYQPKPVGSGKRQPDGSRRC